MAKTYDKVRYIETSGFNPHYNLAVESALLNAAKDGELIVYLWRNDNTVVIGRHQNAYLDVNIKKLHDAGGFLARRPTGGGAVFHDKGNLNFSFITSLSDYYPRGEKTRAFCGSQRTKRHRHRRAKVFGQRISQNPDGGVASRYDFNIRRHVENYAQLSD